IMMFLRLVQVCLILALCSSSSGFSCRWISHKFGDLHDQYLRLLREMVSFLYAKNIYLIYAVNILTDLCIYLKYISELLNEDDSIYWNEKQMGNLLSTLERQTEGLRSCVSVISEYLLRLLKTLYLFFYHQVSTWEQIRKELLKVLSLLEFLPALSATEFTN
ncbi:interferon a3-like, partial [Astyanax mexicanus]